jgi:hypothetical protein
MHLSRAEELPRHSEIVAHLREVRRGEVKWGGLGARPIPRAHHLMVIRSHSAQAAVFGFSPRAADR